MIPESGVLLQMQGDDYWRLHSIVSRHLTRHDCTRARSAFLCTGRATLQRRNSELSAKTAQQATGERHAFHDALAIGPGHRIPDDAGRAGRSPA